MINCHPLFKDYITKNLKLPTVCPCCGGDLTVTQSGYVECQNITCRNKVKHMFAEFFTKLEIEGAGEGFIEALANSDFKTIKDMLRTDEQNETFWEIFLESLTKNSRGSDIIGFLENNSGLGMLLLDSKLEGWNRVRGRIEQIAQRREFGAISLILPNAVRPIVYPACIQDENGTATKTGT